jgi:hypothetical protein
MTQDSPHDFGVVPEHGDNFEFHIDGGAGQLCRLVAVVQTERGPRRTELTDIAGATWRKISARVIRELAQAMSDKEIEAKKLPTLKAGLNRLSPLVGRELTLLLWALEEDGALGQLEAILHGWRELAREERWWLYAKAAAPGQRPGSGWRRALFHALSESPETRNLPLAEKKSPGKPSRSRRLASQPGHTQPKQMPTSPTVEPSRPPQSAARAKRNKTVGPATNPSN